MDRREIIAEMYLVARNIERLQARFDELEMNLHEKTEMARFLRRKASESKIAKMDSNQCSILEENTEVESEKVESDDYEQIETPEDGDEDGEVVYSISKPANEILAAIRARAPKGLHCRVADRLQGDMKTALQGLINNKIIKKVGIGRNYFYQENQ